MKSGRKIKPCFCPLHIYMKGLIFLKTEYNISDYELDNIAKLFLPEIQKYFESEKGRNEYEAWILQQKNAA